MKKIAVFASGAGTNTQSIIDYFRNDHAVEVSVVVSDKPEAGVINIAKENNIPVKIISRDDIINGRNITDFLSDRKVNLIVLAGFLKKIPIELINAFPDQIINIHPALLPAFGGKGMYGMRVHEAVINAGEKQSGITIHYVNEKYDDGKIIAQFRCFLEAGESPESLAQKIHQLEYEHYPETIADLLKVPPF